MLRAGEHYLGFRFGEMDALHIQRDYIKNHCKEITEEIKSSVDYVVNFRQNETTLPKPSSIIKLGKGNVIQIIRE